METKQRVFIIHGWDGHPRDAWLPWLKNELTAKGVSVSLPTMPDPNTPTIEAWVAHLSDVVGKANEQTFFVGHSLGCQAILRYLETLAPGSKVGGVVCVAGFMSLFLEKEAPEDREIAKPWLETPINFEKVRFSVIHGITALFSDDDPVVPVENMNFFEKRLKAKTRLLHHRGHFDRGSKITEVPEALLALEKMLKAASA